MRSIANQPLVSIVVPIYNVEKYLKTCLDSIISQTYKNIEIILVNDGSSDKSGMICDVYKEKDLRINVFHQVNQGVSVARNVGIDNAIGEFITFIDSDDYWEPSYIEVMLACFFEMQVDLVFCGVDREFDNGEHLIYARAPKKSISGKNIEIVVWANNGYQIGGVCKLYDLHIIKEHNIRFIKGLKNGEDWLFLKHFLCFSKNIVHCGDVLYHAVTRVDSARSNFLSKHFSQERLLLWEAIKKWECENYGILPNSGEYDPWTNQKLEIATDLLIDSYRHQYFDYLSYADIQRFIRQNRWLFLKCGKMSLIHKAKLLFKLFFPKIYLKTKKYF